MPFQYSFERQKPSVQAEYKERLEKTIASRFVVVGYAFN